MKRRKLAPAAPSDDFHHAPSTPEHPEPSSPFKKGAPSTRRCCPDRMVLGFPPTRGKVDRGFPRCPPGRNGATRKRHRIRVGQADRDFSRPPPTKDPRRTGAPPPSFAAHEHAPPRTCSHHRRLFVNSSTRPGRWRYTTTPGHGTAAAQIGRAHV